MKANDYVNQFSSLYNGVLSDHESLQLELYKCEGLQQDILHEIELSEVGNTLGSIMKGFRLYKQLRDVRRKRRELKNELELITIVKDNLIDMESLKTTQDKVNKKIAQHDNASYHKRIDENGDITDAMYSKNAKKLQSKAKKETETGYVFSPNAATSLGWECEIVRENAKYYIVNVRDNNGAIQMNVKYTKGKIIKNM